MKNGRDERELEGRPLLERVDRDRRTLEPEHPARRAVLVVAAIVLWIWIVGALVAIGALFVLAFWP